MPKLGPVEVRRAKRAGGELTDNERLKREGSVDKATGKAKDAVEKTSDKVKDVLDRDGK